MVQGYVDRHFRPMADMLGRQLDGAAPGGGASLCVYHRGEVVVDAWAGEAERDRPWEQGTLAMCYSTSKGVASTALHLLADRGLVDYDAPVARYWPEFAQNGKEGVLVRHVLTHSAGLHGLRVNIDHAHRMYDWEHMVAALAAAKPAYEPGTRHGYHALTYGWLVGEVVSRASGRRFEEFVEEELAEPLGLDGLHYGVPEEERHRLAPLRPVEVQDTRAAGLATAPFMKPVGRLLGKAVSLARSPVNTRRMVNTFAPRGMRDTLWRPEVLDAVIPSANGFFTARSLARVYAMLAGLGEVDGVRLLSPETVLAASKVHGHGLDLVLVMPMQWRLGYHLVGTTRGILPHAFGHFGFGGSGGWADLSRSLAVAYVPNHGTGTPIGDLRLVRLGGAAVGCADSRPWVSLRPSPTPTRRRAPASRRAATA